MLTRLFSTAALAVFLMGWAAPATVTAEPNLNANALASHIHQRINNQRKQHKKKSLKRDARLRAIARKHSEDMARHDYLSHTNRKGESPHERAEKAGYKCAVRISARTTRGIAENLFLGSLLRSTRITIVNGKKTVHRDYISMNDLAKEAVDGWMKSPGHRANILAPHHTREGIGIAVSSDGQVYVTQVFC